MALHRRYRKVPGAGIVVELIAGPHRNRRIRRSHARYVMLADTDTLMEAYAWKLQEQLAVEAADYLVRHGDCDLLVLGTGQPASSRGKVMTGRQPLHGMSLAGAAADVAPPETSVIGSGPGTVRVDVRDLLHGMVFRRETILRNGLLLDQSGMDDLDFAIRFLDCASSVHCLDDALTAAVILGLRE